MTFNISNEDINKCKKWSYENIYFFIMVIYMAMANGYTQVLSYPPSKGIWTSFIPLFLTIYLIKRNKTCFTKQFKMFVTVISVWIILQIIKYQHFYAMNFFLLYNVVMAYIIVSVFGLRIIFLYEKHVTLLAKISLFVWIAYNIFPNFIASSFQAFFTEGTGTLIANAFVVGLVDTRDILGFRNAGFAQEPGFFASFLIIAMFFNLLINNYKYLNKHFIILLLALITSQSTTGYIAFGVILLLIVSQSKKGKTAVIILLIITLPSIIALPFMREKIINYKSDKNSIENVVMTADYVETNYNEAVYVPQRFDGFILECMNFLHDPLLGYGVKEKETSYVCRELSPLISCSNGNIKVFSRFGIVLGMLFFIMLYKTGRILDVNNPKKIAFIFCLLYLMISMSYEIATIPLLLSIWSLGYYVKR